MMLLIINLFYRHLFMLNQIISFSVRNKLIIGLFVLALIGWGTYEVTRLPIDALPDITDNQVQVITVSPSLGAPDIERLITFPIEQACSNIPGLKQIRSFSRFGLSLVTIVFNEATDVYWARQQISERLQAVREELPQGIGAPQLAPVSTGLGEIYQYVLRPLPGYEERYDAMELRTLQDWIVRRQLLGTPGVADVSSFGGRLKQYEIAVRQEQLKAYRLTITDIFDALSRNNENTGGAYIEKGPTVLYIRSEGLTTSLEDIGNIVVKNLDNGMPLLMRDVTKVQLGSAIRYGAMTYNDKGEVAGAVVMMLKGENAAEVVKRVRNKMTEIQKMLPQGVVIEPFLDRTKMVNNAISTVETNLVEGALIVIFVLVFFLGNLRAGLIVSSVIPLSMLFAIILMNFTGVGGNLMSLGAIDFGLIVDGSVIVVEAILHRFSHSRHFRSLARIDQPAMDEEVSRSTGSMIKSAVFSQIIILIVYLPILSLQGIEGKMFKPMAFTIAYAILGAFILSVTYVPMMAALCLSKKLRHTPTLTDKLIIWLERKYQPLLHRILRLPRTIILTTLSLFVLAVFLLSRMGGEFIPQLEEGDFAVETRLLTGSNLKETITATQKASKILLERFPEVLKIVTKIGSAEIPTDPMPFEAGDMIVVLKDKKHWTSAKTFPELSSRMTEALADIPGITAGFQFPVQMRFNELMTGARQDVVCKIYGEDLDSLSHYASRLNSIAQTVKGAVNIYEERVNGMPQVVIRYDRDAMARYGLDVSQINRVVNTAFAGQVGGQVYEGEKRFDIAVRLDGESRQQLEDIRNLMIATPQGLQIPLSTVARIEETEGVNQVQRENTRRRIIVGFNIKDRDVQSVVEELKQKISKELSLPKGYQIVFGGSFENMTAAKARLSIVVPIALLMIFLLLYFAFSSVKQGLLIYTAIPLSTIGGILALWMRGLPFSISAGVGFIALFGVAVLNGILLVSEFNRLKQEGWTDPRRIVVHATRSKLRAVLMTALVPSLGFIPMAVSTGAGGEVQKPLATVVIGGLIVSTLLTLFVLPLLYTLFEKGWGYFKVNKTAALLLVLFALPALSHARKQVSLEAVLDSALQYNVRLNASRERAEYQSRLQATAWDLEHTTITAEYGNFNSRFADNRLAVVQNILFPTVYTRQAGVNRLQTAISLDQVRINEQELRYAVKSVYYELLVLRSKKLLLQQADSIYSNFRQKSEQRFKAGDIDIVERTTSQNQQQQIAHQLSTLDADYSILQRQLGLLMNSTEAIEPLPGTEIYPVVPLQDTGVSDNPALVLQLRQLNLAEQERRLERSRLLPTLSLGYNNTSIVGWQTDQHGADHYYNGSSRFSSVSVGLGIPLFSFGQRARIKASSTLIRQQRLELEATRLQLQTELEQAQHLYRKSRLLVASYTTELLPNAATIIRTATDKLHAGEIGFLDWVLLINQSFQIRNDYCNTVKEMNETAFRIEKLQAHQ